MSRKQSTAGGSLSPPGSSAPETITSVSSAEPPESSGHRIPWDEPLDTTRSEISLGGISQAIEEMNISGEGVDPCARDPMESDPNDLARADSEKGIVSTPDVSTPDVSTFDMDLGGFLMDRLDGHVMSKFQRAMPSLIVSPSINK